MLADPPAEAHPDQQVGMDQPDQVVCAPGAEDLPVPGVVAHEGDLGEHHRQVGGSEQLPPGVSEEDEGGPSAGEQGAVGRHLGQVPSAPAVQQTGPLDLFGELAVLAPAARR
jgi:hypothetical protein